MAATHAPPPEAVGTISVQVLRALLFHAASRGHDPAALARGFGVDPGVLADPDGRVPAMVMVRVWNELSALLDDPHLGLTLAEVAKPSALSIAGYLMQAAPTLGDALKILLRYERLLQDTGGTVLEALPDALRVVHRHPVGVDVPGHVAEFGLAVTTHMARRNTGATLVARAIFFEHPRPADTSRHREVFGVEPAFSAGRTEVVIPRAVLDLPQRTADPMLSEILSRDAEALMAKLPRKGDLVDLARRAVAESLPSGDATLERVARRVGVPPRTLQRRLRESGCTLQSMVDDVRRALAERHLSDPTASVSEVALLLGFSEVSAFYRAFTRWTGVPPARWRRDHST
ncbi:MAG: AraC family transcriptional regulator [Polyangiales bacterium]